MSKDALQRDVFAPIPIIQEARELANLLQYSEVGRMPHLLRRLAADLEHRTQQVSELGREVARLQDNPCPTPTPPPAP